MKKKKKSINVKKPKKLKRAQYKELPPIVKVEVPMVEDDRESNLVRQFHDYWN